MNLENVYNQHIGIDLKIKIFLNVSYKRGIPTEWIEISEEKEKGKLSMRYTKEEVINSLHLIR